MSPAVVRGEALRPGTPTRQIILASTSRYRRELLERLALPFTTEAPQVDEAPQLGETPRARAERLALAKARAVASRHPQALVIGADQVCETGGCVLGKPGDLARQREMLQSLAGGSAVFHTAVALVGIEAGLWRRHSDETRCVFRPLTLAEIDWYIGAEPALDCAGGFKVEGLGIGLLQNITSQDPTALIGLPLIWLAHELLSHQ
jgi:septum formation protein